MIIKEISLKNFQCYHGEHNDNKIIFSSGVNLIIGNNGAGKSKLFDAFYWVIYNQIFLSDTRRFVYTNEYKASLISDKAKAVAAMGKTVSAEVTLVVVDSRDREFRITRIYKAKKTSDREWAEDRDSELLIQEIKAGAPQYVQQIKHEHILNMVIPGHLKPYMWFQGEQVDSLMDLTNKSSLKQTINLLSDISDYDKLIEVAKQGALRANKDLRKARTDSSKNKHESQRLADFEIELRSDIENHARDIDDYKTEIQSAKERIEELVGSKTDAEIKIQLKAQRAVAERERKSAELALESTLKMLNGRLFKDLWLLRNVEPFAEKFVQKYKNYNNVHLQTLASLKLTEHRLPVNVPRPIDLQEMLDAHECFLCGREAAEGTEAFERIKSHLERDKPQAELAFSNDCSDFFGKLYENSIGLRHSIASLVESIPSEFQKINELKARVAAAAAELESIDKQFEGLLEDDGSENIVAEYRQHEANRTKYEGLLQISENKLRECHSKLATTLSQQASLSKGQVDSEVELSAEVWSALESLTCSTKEFVFSQLVDELESAANTIFAEMTSRNRSITGRLRLNIVSNEKVRAEIVDGEGFPISSSNDSNIILVKLALMMAILKSKALWSQNYSMVTDAPTSKMANEYSQGFYDALSNNFNQAIVMTYDFLRDEELQQLGEIALGKVYRLEPQYPEDNREDRTNLSVRIVEVNV